MSSFFRRGGWLPRLEMPDVLTRSFSAVRQFIPLHMDFQPSTADKLRRRCTDSAIRLILSDENGVLIESKLEVLRQLMKDETPPDLIDRHINELRIQSSLSTEEMIRAFASFLDDERNKLMNFLLSLAAAADTPPEKVDELRRIFVAAGADEGLFADYREETQVAEERRRRIIGSGAGIAVALVVILVFIATAIWLRSVIFGLILAYILLPVEKCFEKQERDRSGFFHYLFLILSLPFRVLSLPLVPLKKLSRKIMRHNRSDAAVDPAEENRRKERKIITKAVAQTVLATLVVVVGIGFAAISAIGPAATRGISSAFKYIMINDAGANAETEDNVDNPSDCKTGTPAVKSSDEVKTTRHAADAKAKKEGASTSSPSVADDRGKSDGEGAAAGQKSELEKKLSTVASNVDGKLVELSKKMEKQPLVKDIVEQVRTKLKDKNAQKKFIDWLLKNSGGLFSFTTGKLQSAIIWTGALITDLLLTVFFAMLFLMKMAEFCRDDISSQQKSAYLVRTVFNGHWLPDTDEVVVGEAKRILGGIMERIGTWARGYLTLVCVDATVYTTIFFLLRVQYWYILGPIAGCGILLPYIGPVLSASLTLVVTLAVGDYGGWQLAGILAAYLIYNGIVEQFILYPAVIGESLGLTTLETIVVVLLGAVVAGIPGMFFALPVASVLKFLIPQIIQYLKLRKSARNEAGADGGGVTQ